ncbi:MAG: DUF1987 domain-containing protein [Bacteroidales bacterium]|jgi:hypothetical protein|nr:DUF1987 domain-containing protein [Bacteroidales bacterium]
MESVRIEKTIKSPLFVLKDGYIGMMGRSIPQNARMLYKPCFDWVEAYIKNPAPTTKIELFFEYIDTSSIRCVVDLLIALEANAKGSRIEVNWYYEIYDEDMHELGTYIQTFMKIPFNFIIVEEDQEIVM